MLLYVHERGSTVRRDEAIVAQWQIMGPGLAFEAAHESHLD